MIVGKSKKGVRLVRSEKRGGKKAAGIRLAKNEISKLEGEEE